MKSKYVINRHDFEVYYANNDISYDEFVNTIYERNNGKQPLIDKIGHQFVLWLQMVPQNNSSSEDIKNYIESQIAINENPIKEGLRRVKSEKKPQTSSKIPARRVQSSHL